MVNVYKRITSGASYYTVTDAVGTLESAKKRGFLQCGSGDDHCLTKTEMELIDNHNPKDGDLRLPEGPLGRYLLKRFRRS